MEHKEETRGEQFARLRRELGELKGRFPLSEEDKQRFLEIVDEMGDLQEFIEAWERAARVTPKQPPSVS